MIETITRQYTAFITCCPEHDDGARTGLVSFPRAPFFFSHALAPPHVLERPRSRIVVPSGVPACHGRRHRLAASSSLFLLSGVKMSISNISSGRASLGHSWRNRPMSFSSELTRQPTSRKWSGACLLGLCCRQRPATLCCFVVLRQRRRTSTTHFSCYYGYPIPPADLAKLRVGHSGGGVDGSRPKIKKSKICALGLWARVLRTSPTHRFSIFWFLTEIHQLPIWDF